MLVRESISASRLPGRKPPLSAGSPWGWSKSREKANHTVSSPALSPPTPNPRAHLRALGCSMAPHPGQPPILRSPRGLVTLLRREGAKIDPGVGLECWVEGRESEGGVGEGEGDTCGRRRLGSLFSPPPRPHPRTWGPRMGQEAGRAARGQGWRGPAGLGKGRQWRAQREAGATGQR